MLVTNPRKQRLYIQVNDSLGFADLTTGTGEVKSTPLPELKIWLKLKWDFVLQYHSTFCV